MSFARKGTKAFRTYSRKNPRHLALSVRGGRIVAEVRKEGENDPWRSRGITGLGWTRATRWVCVNNRPKWSPTLLFSKNVIHSFKCGEKSSPKI
jgi:hypothetical protein